MDHHFSSPMLSNWQSAVAKVATSPIALGAGGAFLNALRRLPLDFEHPLVAAGTFAANAFKTAIDGGAPAAPTGGFDRCAKAALNLAIAQVQRDEEGIKATQALLARDGECDPRWAECITEFLAHYALTRHGIPPYRPWRTLDDFVLELPSPCRIGVVGDWGTGDTRAQAVLEQVATYGIDLLVHLGDIYYSCTTAEASVFYDNVRAVFDRSSPVRIVTLSGNHDMYSGGAPYYALLDRLDQPASFFCLRNADWQIVAGDTGYNDFDPFDHGDIASWLQDDDDPDAPYSELAWHAHKFQTAAGRRTVLLTHHQPFTRNAAIGGSKAVNRRLLGQLQPFLPQIDLWLWGHEHNQVVYAPFMGVARGRCVGGSAIPVPQDTDLAGIDPAITEPVPDVAPGAKPLGIDAATDLHNLGYAIIELTKGGGTESYYELDTSRQEARELFRAGF